MSTKILGNEELNILRAKTPYSLPDNPSDKGFNARQIKTKFWEGYLLLFNWLKETQASLNNDFATTNSALLNESKRIDVILTYFSNGKANFAVRDRNNNIIDETYELKSEASTKFNQLIADIQSVQSASGNKITGTQNINADGIQYTITLSNTQNATLSTITQYLPLATTLKAGLLSSTDKEKINNIESDLTNFLANAKAYTDEKLQRDNIVNILGSASHTLIGLLTSEDKKKIDALYALLGEQEDADTVVNTINEVLAIFSNYPEGVDIVSQLEKKVNYSDIINTLDSEETSKPLSAKMGKELKTEVDTKAELAYVNEELDKKALKSDILIIDEAVTAQESEITTTQNEGDKLVDEIVGYVDGSPRGVYASLSALQSAFPSGAQGVYLTSDNGHWYYWSGTAWADGGLYLSNISNAVYCIDNVLKDINNSILTISKLNMPYEIVNKTYTLTSGKYINADGGVSNGDQYKYTSNISLSKGEMVEFYGEGYSTNVAIISTIISDQRIPQVISIDNSLRYYQFMAVEDCEICVSYRDLGTADLRFYKFGDYTAINDNCAYAIDEIKSKSCTLSDNVVWNTGKYINAVGGMSISDQTQYSNPMQFNKGDIVVIKARGFDKNVAMISIYENGKYTPVVISDNRDWKDYTYYCGADCYLVFCTYTWATFTNARIFKSNFMKKYHDYINYEINKLNLDFNERDYFDFAVFENIGVVGDSYASGYIDNSSKYNLSWLQIMARNLGVTGYNFSSGGMTTATWLTDANRGLQYLLNTQKCGLYFLALGINDYINGGANYLGSIADINDSDPSQNANSFYGNYGKIISQIQTYSPSSRLVLLTIARDGNIPTSYNNAIIEIANHFNIPYIVQLDDWYFKSTIYNNMINGHPTALGYSGMSKALQRLLTKCVINNFDYFKNYIGIS